MKKLYAVLLIALLLTGCETETATPTSTASVSTSSRPTQSATPPVEVSPLAVQDFLDFENASYPLENDAEFVMIHFTSAVMLDRENPYDYDLVRGIFEDNRLGIHYIIDRDGTIYCFLPESHAAWHAGKGSFGDEKYTDNMNRHSIGIELMGIGSQEDMSIYLHPEEYDRLNAEFIGFTDAQYTALGALVQDICQRREIAMDRQHIIGHQEYNPAKNDPGELFDWARFMGILSQK
ncbi:MAG: N-acetylmuramoyl-L-alanine amidase [Ruminococcaceae bacterium]|nr:N-acetylmuramoyl-L-alanine amidase [Oscillospiraceae bacterium]